MADQAARHLHKLLQDNSLALLRLRFLFCFAILFSTNIQATPLRVAVAANFKSTLVSLVAAYPKDDLEIDIIAGSTGTLYSQIRRGAPFDLFLAADSLHPQLLEQENLSASGSRFTYAIGQLVFWVPKNAQTVDQSTLQTFQAAIAIANPKLAPYGQAAMTVLEKLKPEHRAFVYCNNVNQVFQFVDSGNVNAGFVSLAQVQHFASASNWWLVPPSNYPALIQQAIILASSHPAAEDFAKFLQSKVGRQIIESAGYLTPAVR